MVDWASGYGSGYSHVDYLDQNGINPEFILPGLVSGLITEIAGNSTHVWAATTSRSFQSNGVQTSSGILQGTRLANNSVEWTNGWSLPVPTEVRSMDLIQTPSTLLHQCRADDAGPDQWIVCRFQTQSTGLWMEQ